MFSFKERLLSVCPDLPKELIPKGYYRLGNVIILRSRKKWDMFTDKIGNCILSLFPWARAVIIQIDTEGVYRRPVSKLIAGNLEIPLIHKELGTYFVLDPLKITFSPGNHYERELLLHEIKNGVVVDMFACVGNLSMPLSVINNVKVYGVEISPYTFDFLVSTVKKNQVRTRYVPILGDNRKVTPVNVADYVLMGYFGWDLSQLRSALRALRSGKGVVYSHYLVPRGSDVASIFINAVNSLSAEVIDLEVRKVKSFSPRKVHYVIIANIQHVS